ncbi:MAG TPA: endonuclease/exonuclease/phosphatase family protein [Candidatus Limnocylindria bacterium]|nr:endonuclease/exonuclease/phosphatase family protein [Candidatus Limnocylindria bacterium]
MSVTAVSLPTRMVIATIAAVLATGLILSAATVGAATGGAHTVRFATFNASLNRSAAGQALNDLSQPYDAGEADATLRGRRAQAANVAEIIQRTRPDVLLINEFDFEPNHALAIAFQENYLSVSQNGAEPIEYPHVFIAPSNTGMPSGKDLNNNGTVGGPDDALGFGFFPGQFGMAVFSRYPIERSAVRTFQTFLWEDMPGALLPDDPATAAPNDWYAPDELDIFRLSSKSHWDVPLRVRGTTIHFLVSHPTPPVFDGAEDRNGTRNHDEIRFWADYVTPGAGAYIYDDRGIRGGLAAGARFVIAGDQNSDPLDGDSIPGSIQQLLDNPRINATMTPSSAGGPYWAVVQDGLNDTHRGDPAFDTADFCDTAVPPPCSGPGNLRVDYVLPSADLPIAASGVFWPTASDPLVRLTGAGFPVPSSDHRLVWVDVRVQSGGR